MLRESSYLNFYHQFIKLYVCKISQIIFLLDSRALQIFEADFVFVKSLFPAGLTQCFLSCSSIIFKDILTIYIEMM